MQVEKNKKQVIGWKGPPLAATWSQCTVDGSSPALREEIVSKISQRNKSRKTRMFQTRAFYKNCCSHREYCVNLFFTVTKKKQKKYVTIHTYI